MRFTIKNIKFVLLTLCFCFIFVPLGCAQKYKLTIKNPDGFTLIEKLDKSYAAGEKITLKIGIVTDIGLIAYLDGESLGSQTAVKDGDNGYHWEYYFVMPDHNATLSFKVVDGMLG